MKKMILVGSIIVLFIGLGIQPAFAIETKSSELIENPSINEGLPDLIVVDLDFHEHDPGSRFYYVYCDIINQGDDYAYGDLTIEFKVIKTFFWWFNLGTIHEESYSRDLGNGLAPGGKIYTMPYCDTSFLPPFCFARFIVEVNTDNQIIESNYDNNKDMLKVYNSLFGWNKRCLWLPW
jgi:hypothetical protein